MGLQFFYQQETANKHGQGDIANKSSKSLCTAVENTWIIVGFKLSISFISSLYIYQTFLWPSTTRKNV